MGQINRSVEQLQKASEHLYYEFWMFRSLANGLGLSLIGDGPVGNAMLESFVIHVRSIMYFLYSERPKPDDVIAENFFDEPVQWKKIRPNLSSLLSNVKRRVGKEVVHLTYHRLNITPEAKQWNFIEITHEISNVMKVFLENVEQEKLGEKWKNKFFL